VHVPASASLRCTTELAALADAELVLVCVKSRDTATVGRALAELLRDRAEPPLVISLQNGLRNPDVLREQGLRRVLAGMVSFNVFEQDGEYRQATSGPLVVEVAPPFPASELVTLARIAQSCDLELEQRDDMLAVQAGKLLLNLNNAICTLAGTSIAESLRSRDLRRCFAASMREGLAILRGAGIPAKPFLKLPIGLLPHVLGLPDAIVLRVAKSLISIDPGARSSTLQDLERGRPTEIDALNGELVALADRHGLPCPVNRWIVARIHAMEREQPPRFHAPNELWATIAGLR
jgi:2-dehydropantoate 2-reductase